MKQLIGKLNDLWPEHSVALSIPKEVDRSKEKLEGAWETIGIELSDRYTIAYRYIYVCVCTYSKLYGKLKLNCFFANV